MASLAAEYKPTVLGIPGQVPIPYQLECTVVLLQSLHALFQLLTSGNTMQHCPQAATFAALGTAARQDNGHIVSMASSLALALRSGIFFHEYGRRVGMVPRSSLKGGKNSLMGWRKEQEPQTQPKTNNKKPTGRVSIM